MPSLDYAIPGLCHPWTMLCIHIKNEKTNKDNTILKTYTSIHFSISATENMDRNSGQLTLITGPMYSGKSTELIRLIRRYICSNKSVLSIKYVSDKRYGSDKIITHNKDEESAIMLGHLNEVESSLISNTDIIAIDEGQFFPDLEETVLEWLEKYPGVTIIIAGLSGNYMRSIFTGNCSNIWNLAPRASNIKFFTGICGKCSYDGAAYTVKLPGHKMNQFEIGSSETYVCVCEQCYRAMNTY